MTRADLDRAIEGPPGASWHPTERRPVGRDAGWLCNGHWAVDVYGLDVSDVVLDRAIDNGVVVALVADASRRLVPLTEVGRVAETPMVPGTGTPAVPCRQCDGSGECVCGDCDATHDCGACAGRGVSVPEKREGFRPGAPGFVRYVAPTPNGTRISVIDRYVALMDGLDVLVSDLDMSAMSPVVGRDVLGIVRAVVMPFRGST